MRTTLAWHFLPASGCIAQYYDEDGNPKPHCGKKIEVGTKLSLDGELKLCSHGLHASVRLIDALKYAESSLLCRVELCGEILRGEDKCVASERTVIAMLDCTNILHEAACHCAEQALSTQTNVDPRSVAAVEAKRAWLRGEISDEQLTAARSAAWVAAMDAAWDAAKAAAWYAARSAAWDAAWVAQNTYLEDVVLTAMGLKEIVGQD